MLDCSQLDAAVASNLYKKTSQDVFTDSPPWLPSGCYSILPSPTLALYYSIFPSSCGLKHHPMILSWCDCSLANYAFFTHSETVRLCQRELPLHKFDDRDRGCIILMEWYWNLVSLLKMVDSLCLYSWCMQKALWWMEGTTRTIPGRVGRKFFSVPWIPTRRQRNRSGSPFWSCRSSTRLCSSYRDNKCWRKDTEQCIGHQLCEWQTQLFCVKLLI